MLSVNNYGKLRKYNRLCQSYLYVSNAILDISANREINVIGMASSFTDKKGKDTICENVCENICKQGNKICLITADIDINDKNYDLNETAGDGFKKIKTQNISVNKLKELVEKEKNNDLVIINLPPVNIFAQALEYAKICKNILLIEKYCHSKYDEFENTIDILKQNNIAVLGIITYV
ncbi:MAG: hypothetical protein LBR79_06580 [Oscillospiraceae bacterium]|jgi:late competence protein required for DNA uptake (superfamily II DNA/RNA helicase)|nr:hypothetical protein [Oscillospiraceae bacterium]